MSDELFSFRRQLSMRIEGQVRTGELTIALPKKISEKGRADCWACYWLLSPLEPSPKCIYGEDALSAFTNCINFLHDYIQNLAADDVVIWWLEEGDIAGLTWA